VVVIGGTGSQVRPRRDGRPHRGDPDPDRASRMPRTQG
jgi:hypothetical protein